MRGRVHRSQGGIYLVELDSGQVVEATLRGRLKREGRTGDKVVIGDRVDVSARSDGTTTIEEVEERRSEVVRRGPGGRRPKVVAANVDRLVVVAAAARPEPTQVVLDRLLVVGESNGLESVVVLNKADLVRETGEAPSAESGQRRVQRCTFQHLSELYRTIGYPVFETSVVSGEGIQALGQVLCQGISALVGPSGVGKSSLLNAIEPGLDLRTGELSHRVGRGRQTTVTARLLTLGCGGMVADTPGFSDVGLWGVDQRILETCFPEFQAYRQECRFRGCSHLHEPECQVRGALEGGEIDAARFASYRAMVEESSRD